MQAGCEPCFPTHSLLIDVRFVVSVNTSQFYSWEGEISRPDYRHLWSQVCVVLVSVNDEQATGAGMSQSHLRSTSRYRKMGLCSGAGCRRPGSAWHACWSCIHIGACFSPSRRVKMVNTAVGDTTTPTSLRGADAYYGQNLSNIARLGSYCV